MTNLNLDAILLTVEEVKIPASGHSIVPVIVPIHPRLIEDKTLKFDPNCLTTLISLKLLSRAGVQSWKSITSRKNMKIVAKNHFVKCFLMES